jgi:hypothetical protein
MIESFSNVKIVFGSGSEENIWQTGEVKNLIEYTYFS